MSAETVPAVNPPRTGYKKGFWFLIATQFQGAFNDNMFKFLIIYTLWDILKAKSGGTLDQSVSERVVFMAGLLFSIPFIIFPGYAGAFSDRNSKKDVAVWVKCLEIGIMLLGTGAFYLQNEYLFWVLLFLMATHSTIFSPSKYGLLPEILPESRLSWGNGILQMMTMVAIISGVGLAGPVYGLLHTQVYWAGILLTGLSCIGLLTSFGITRPLPANPQQRIPLNPWSGMGRDFRIMWNDRWLLLTIIGYMYFWFLGQFLQQNMMVFGKMTLELNETQISIMNALLVLGIGTGSVLAGTLSRGKIEVGLIPLGAAGLSIFAAMLAVPGTTYLGALALLFCIGASAGFYDIPLAATLQQRSPEKTRGGMLATSNMLTFVGMALASVLYGALIELPKHTNMAPLTTHHKFLLAAILSAVVGIYICSLLPIFVVRFVLWMLTSTVYRIDVRGRQNLPDKGGVLLVANHTSYVDALMILASTDRQIRFLMYKGIYDSPFVRPIAKLMGVIPIAAHQGPREMAKSLKAASAALEAGEAVCIFAEGQITRTGQLLPFRKGFELIVKGIDAPIVPVHLGNLWGSVFGFSKGRFLWKLPEKFPYPVTVNYGAPMPSNSPANAVRQAVQELGTQGFTELSHPLLHRAFASRARRRPFAQAIADGLVPKVSRIQALAGSLVLARKLKRALSNEKMTGVLLPPSVGGTLVNVALQWLGRIPVNLNYTASAEAIESACSQCGIAQIITSEMFLEKAKVESPRPVLLLEEIRKQITAWDRCVGMLWAVCFPSVLIERLLGAPKGRSENDLATVIFSSGSEGDPKGVMLTHRNVASNIEATLQVFPHDAHDCIIGMLPFFHSMGFMGTLWLPLTSGVRAVYHPNPLDSRIIGGLIFLHKATFLMATSTLLQGFIRRCEPEAMSSLKYIVCGAEKLADRVREACKEKFGIEPIEGYGATECSPLISLNVPNFRVPGFFQRGTKVGTVGHPIPGVSVRIVNPENGEPVEVGESGMLWVAGPNVMQGYWGKPEKTAQVLRDGWYETGDMASVDADGFITITGRLSRFSKIAGEMVPHGKVEESLHELLELTEQALVVVGMPDEQKGEKLVVLHTLDADQLVSLQGKLKESGLPNLWIPAANAFHRIEAIPVLGSGKMDLRGVKGLAGQMEGGPV